MRLAVLLLAACAPPSPEYVVEEPPDLSWAEGDVIRVSPDSCGYHTDSESAFGRPQTSITFESRFTEVTMGLVWIHPDCSETPLDPIGPGDEALHQVVWGNVIRVITPDDEVHSAWQGLFQEGSVVLQ